MLLPIFTMKLKETSKTEEIGERKEERYVETTCFCGVLLMNMQHHKSMKISVLELIEVCSEQKLHGSLKNHTCETRWRSIQKLRGSLKIHIYETRWWSKPIHINPAANISQGLPMYVDLSFFIGLSSWYIIVQSMIMWILTIKDIIYL